MHCAGAIIFLIFTWSILFVFFIELDGFIDVLLHQIVPLIRFAKRIKQINNDYKYNYFDLTM